MSTGSGHAVDARGIAFVAVPSWMSRQSRTIIWRSSLFMEKRIRRATQHNLGRAYWKLPIGDRAQNLKKAIETSEGVKTGKPA